MKPISRRRFVTYAGALVAFAPVLKAVTFDRALAASGTDPFPHLDAPIVAEKYLGGLVAEVNAPQILTKTQDGLVTVALPSPDGIWKGGWATGEPIEVGDDFHAWGDRLGPDTYRADKIHFNIRNLTGVVSNLEGESSATPSFTLLGTREGIIDVRTADRTRVVVDDAEIPVSSSTPIATGEVIQVLGVSRGKFIEAVLVYRSY